MFRLATRVRSLMLSFGWGLLFGFALSSHSYVQKLELNLYDSLLRWRHHQSLPHQILIVEINEEDLQNQALFPGAQRTFYANLVNHLLDAGASVVVSNLPYHWTQTPDPDWHNVETINHPLQELVQNHADQIVLVTPVNSLADTKQPKLRVYYHFLPIEDEALESTILPESIQGFFEYSIGGNNPTRISSFARRAYLQAEFVRADNLEQRQKFESVAVVALKKYNQHQGYSQPNLEKYFLIPTVIGLNFWGKTGTFPRLELKRICSSVENGKCLIGDFSVLASVRDKIVIVGFSNGNNFNTMPIQSPFGDQMPAIEVQANLLASLLTESFNLSIPEWLKLNILIVGAVIIGGSITFIDDISKPQAVRQRLGLIVVTFLGYGCLSLIFFWQHVSFPVVLPLLTWTGSGITALLCSLVNRQHYLIVQQQLEIERHLATEQAAALSQARKILTRTADEIHDGPLQALKLVMDDLELLQLEDSTVDIDSTLDKLEGIGHDLRSSLENTRIMAEKLKITPELRSGLVMGIQIKLKQLRDSGILTLNLIQELQPLIEPECNCDWIDAREDIFRFFNEAIANVIHHAQPPHGTATYVKVSLLKQEMKCHLMIENDGYEPDVNKHEGGYGTKSMSAIAAELPSGKWERRVLPQGKIQVELIWKPNFNPLNPIALNINSVSEVAHTQSTIHPA